MSMSVSMSSLSKTETETETEAETESEIKQRQHHPAAATPSHITKSKQLFSPNMRMSSWSPAPFVRLLNNDPLLQQPRRTHPLVWCIAILCLVFCLLIIIFGITTLITFLVVKPKYPSFDVPNANLNALYFDSPDNFNGDFTLLANFTNPNTKIKLHFDYLHVQLYFVDRLIATQALQPFSQRPGEGRLEMIRLISKLVYLPPNPAFQLQRQVQSNRIEYNIKATFRVTAKLASARFTYWLHSSCNLQMTSPPKGLLLTRDCNTKR